MSLRRVAAILLLVVAFCIVFVWAGVPWYVNSGRATAWIERRLGDELNAHVAIEELHMPGWITLTAGRVSVQREDGLRADIEHLLARAPLRGLLQRRIDEISADRLSVLLPASGLGGLTGGGGAEGGGRDSGALPTVGRLAIDEIAVERLLSGDRTETIATASLAAVPAPEQYYDTTVRAFLPPIDLTVEGTVRVRPGRRPRAADLTFDADWDRVLAYAGAPAAAASGRLTGAVQLEAGVVDVRVQQPGLRLGRLDIGAGDVEMAVRPENILLPTTADVTGTVGAVKLGDTFAAPGPVQLRGGLQFQLLPRRLSWSDVEIEWDAGVVMRSDGTVAFGGAVPTAGVSLALPSLPIEQWTEYGPPLARLIPAGVDVGGALGGTVSAAWSPGAPHVTSRLTWQDGSVMLGDFRQAAGVRVDIEARGDVGPSGVTADATGRIAAGEVLWDAIYMDLAARPIPFQVALAPADQSGAEHAFTMSADLAGLGQWRYETATARATLRGEDIDVAAVVDELLTPAFSEARPWTADLAGAGAARVEIAIETRDGEAVYAGGVELRDVTIRNDADDIAILDLDVEAPFRLGAGATAGSGGPPRLGRVRFGGLQLGPIHLAGAEFPIQVWNNTGVVAAPFSTDLFGGTFTVDAVWGRNLLTPERYWQGEVTFEDVDLAQATAAFRTVPMTGTLNGRLDPIRFSQNTLDIAGNLTATTYGGTVRLTRLGVQDVTSPVRTFTADMDWQGIDLERATSALEFGRITGVLDGWVRGLAIQAGQPAAFEARFETVPTPGVPQTISIDAVNKISLLGTGRGLGGTISRGLGRFFDSYGYRQIGFHCLLENDQFYIDSDVVGPEGQYFVLGTIVPPRINVILRDASQSVSFAEMRRRIEGLQLPASGAEGAEPKGVAE